LNLPRRSTILLEAIVAKIESVSGTAFVVAEFRAEENDEVAPLYRDPIVEFFLDEDTRRAAGLVAAKFPPVKDLVRIRTKYLDDMLEKQILSGIRQVVILGAGLDTRAVRRPAPGVIYFEIDDAATLALKRTCYQQHGINTDVRLISGNYVSDRMIELLGQHDFDFDLPTYVIWEGNTMYLPRASTRNVLAELRTYVKQVRVSFDYMADAVIAKNTGDPGIARLVESFAAMGAPWLSGIRDVQTLASELRFTLIENFETADLYRRYWPGRPISSAIFKFYSVCTLGF
jgi:methyltransferase (TIGR00027 family)